MLAALLVAGLFVGVVWNRPAGIDAPLPAARPDVEKITAAAVTRIAQESRRELPPPVVQAAPGVSSGADSADTRPSSPPTPPEGYAFVEHFGAMTKARIEGRTDDDPQDESGPEWLHSSDAIATLTRQAEAAGRDWSFGWIRLAEGARAGDLAQALRGTGAEIVGASGRLIRARMPGNKALLRSIAALPEVDGVGATPPSLKLEAVAHLAAELLPNEQIPVFVTLMAGDLDGQWRRALEELGAVVGRYDPVIRVYVANGTYDVLEAIAGTDFVMAIEPVGVVEAAHDTAVPAMGADALRMYEGSPGVFSGVGGAPVPIAVMDSGLNINHLDISSNRSSICGANFVYFDPLVDDEDLWVDAGLHGTHVTGTIVGSGMVGGALCGDGAPCAAHSLCQGARPFRVRCRHLHPARHGLSGGTDRMSRSRMVVRAGQTSHREHELVRYGSRVGRKGRAGAQA